MAATDAVPAMTKERSESFTSTSSSDSSYSSSSSSSSSPSSLSSSPATSPPSSPKKPGRTWGCSVLRKGPSPEMIERLKSAPATTSSPPPPPSRGRFESWPSQPSSSKLDIGARFAQARSSAPTTTTTTPPTLEEARIGQVFFLPSNDDIPPSSKAYEKDHGEPWLHPVVVFSKDLENKTVKCRVCTSFTRHGSSGIMSTHKSMASRKQYLLCENSNKGVSPHDGTPLLTMEAGSEIFLKATYINTVNDPITIEYFYLQQYSKAIIFSEESMALLS